MEKIKKERSPKNWASVDYKSFGAKEGIKRVPTPITYQNLNDEDLLAIDIEDAPAESFRGSIEAEILRKRVRKTLGEAGENVPVGKAFPIPTRSKSTVTTLLSREYPELKFRFTGRATDTFTRVVRKA